MRIPAFSDFVHMTVTERRILNFAASESGRAMVDESLVVESGLDIDARRLFLAHAAEVVDRVGGSSVKRMSLDCSRLDRLDDMTLGMLVVIGRQAQRRGVQIVLAGMSARVRADLDTANIENLFA